MSQGHLRLPGPSSFCIVSLSPIESIISLFPASLFVRLFPSSFPHFCGSFVYLPQLLRPCFSVPRSIEYPDYYTRSFHGYDEGNLSWRAAHELAPATQSMCLGYYDGMAWPPGSTRVWRSSNGCVYFYKDLPPKEEQQKNKDENNKCLDPQTTLQNCVLLQIMG